MNKRAFFSIGVISDWIGSYYHVGVMSGIKDAANIHNIEVFCFVTGKINPRYDWEQQRNILFHFPSKSRLDGLIILTSTISSTENKEEIRKFITSLYSGIPIVSIGISIEGFPSVEIDNRVGFKELIEHIIRFHKAKKIAFISGPSSNPEAEIRLNTFLETTEENKNLLEDIKVINGDFSLLSGKEAVAILLDNYHYLPDAIISANDQMAFGIMEELEHRGISVPDDIIVTGFDNVDLGHKMSLTTVHQPIYELGYKSVELLLSLQQCKKSDGIETSVILPTYPIYRKSCGCNNNAEGNISPFHFRSSLHESFQEKLNDLGERLITEFNLSKQMEIFEGAVSFFGIDTFYVSLYENPERPLENSRLIWSYLNNERKQIEKNLTFETQQIIPQRYQPDKCNTYIVQALFHKDNHIGFLVLKFNIKEGMVYDILRQKLSIALRISGLINNLKLYSENLATIVKAKTKELRETNKMLKKEIEERKKVEEKLRESESRFKEIATFLPIAIFETNLNHYLKFINKTGFDLLKLSNIENGINFLSLIHPKDIKKVSDYCRKIIEGKEVNFTEFRVIRKNEDYLSLLSKAIPIIRNGKIEGLRWCCIDLNSVINSIIVPEEAFFKKYHLSQRQKEVFMLLLKGNKIKDIAAKLYITESTVKNHISAIYEEMGVKNKGEFFEVLKQYQLREFGYESFIFSILSYLVKNETLE